MNRKEIILHRKSNNEDCRKYEEEYVQYFYMLKEPVDIRCGHIYFEEINIEDLSENEIINREIIFADFLNLGKKIYDSYLHNEIKNLDYLYKRNITENLYAYTFEEFIQYAIWKHKKIESDLKEWFNNKPFYGIINILDDGTIYGKEIDEYNFIILAVSSYMIYRLYNISYKNIVQNSKTNELSLLSIFSDYIKKEKKSYVTYIDALKSLDAKKIIDYCKKKLNELLYKNIDYNKIHSIIFDDGNIVKIHETLISIVLNSLTVRIMCNSNTLNICQNCGNYYSGHGKSTLCFPCRKYKDNHKHIKTDRS